MRGAGKGWSLARRWWLASTALLESLITSGALLGWSSLLPVLMAEGVFSGLCAQPDEGLNATAGPSDLPDNVSGVVALRDAGGYASCPRQETRLHVAFTVGAFVQAATVLPLGVLMDRYGARRLRQIGSAAFCLSCIFFSYTAANPGNLSTLVFVAVSLNGFGGMCINVSGQMLAEMFQTISNVFSALLLGSFCSAAFTMTILKVMYEAGVPFIYICLGWALLAVVIFLNAMFGWPEEAMTGPAHMNHSIRLKLSFRGSQRGTQGKEFYAQMAAMGYRLRPDLREQHSLLQSADRTSTERSLAFMRSIFTPVMLWSMVTMAVTQLHLTFYLGSLGSLLPGGPADTELYVTVFGLLQPLCLLVCPLLGHLLMRETAASRADPAVAESEEERDLSRKITKVRRAMCVFFTTSVLLLAFGITSLVPNLHLQIATFILHTVDRAAVAMACNELYTAVFPESHFGYLNGVQFLASALVTLLQHPLHLVLVDDTLADSALWVNGLLLAVSVLSLGLPFYLLYYQRRLAKELGENSAVCSQPTLPEEAHTTK
ncbi:large neutral amino acids transporter small subunit 4-like [Petromyzon marinus]|uniref:Large neutral amino acids transporter small subunit 4-like n=2 Tax=Petromyzon marinus TaxID=7757 RepID=A0AAJ7TSV1_PETMA|nr:large neutral amino acids transporter small subunit 4-like [Petromyzon marinus]